MSAALFSFALASLFIELTPGPNMAYLAILSAERGRAAGLAAVAGVALGLTLLGLLAVFGLGALVLDQPILFQTLRWAGIAYLIYLAWEAWTEAHRPIRAVDDRAGAWRFFRRGLVTNLLNPKAAIFYVTVMPGFLPTPSIGNALIFGAIYVLVATLVHAGVVLAAGTLQPLLTTDRHRRQMGTVFALLLLGIALWVGISTAR
jgi:threonine/homoserine/homoserine lactone efflux protein